MKKTIIGIVLMLVIIGIILFKNINLLSFDKEIKESNSTIPFANSVISLMYETSSGSGEYIETNDTNWPVEGYKFNSALSKCENGGTLTWDEINKKVLMSTTGSDKCYVYFDLWTLPVITSVTLATDNDCSGETGITAVEFDQKCTVAEYYLNINNTSYKKVEVNPYQTCYSGFDCLTNNKSYNYSLYAVLSDGSVTEPYTSSYFVPSCFVAGTKVLTETGLKNIEDINIKDKVYSYNEKTKSIELNKVTQKYIHTDTEIYEIKVGNEIIKVTSLHRFYVKKRYSLFGEWVAVKDLSINDYLYNNFNQWVKISSLFNYKENNTVYNLEVENNHTYYISNNKYLVHNAKAACSSGNIV